MSDQLYDGNAEIELYNAAAEEFNNYIKELAKEVGCSYETAHDVYYLRTRSRWTPELEKELIKRCENGEAVNMNEFGCKTSPPPNTVVGTKWRN